MAKTVLVLVLGMDKEPWRTIETQGQEATWAAGSSNVFWLHGKTGGLARLLTRVVDKSLRVLGSKKLLDRGRHMLGAWAVRRPVVRSGNRIVTGVPETYINTNAKTRAALRFLLRNHSFDYLLRTNTSTYVNLPLLARIVETLPAMGYYGGPVWQKDGIDFASGTGMLLSRDMVELIAADPHWEYGIIDDVAVGRSMHRHGIPVHPQKRIDVLNDADLRNLDPAELGSTLVVRCKGVAGRDHDIRAMHRIHALYHEIELASVGD